jgi:hypothetical protein
VGLIQAAEAAMWDHVDKIYTGNLTATNSSLSLESSPQNGLAISKFISNGTDVLQTVLPQSLGAEMDTRGTSWHAQLTPTLLFKNESSQQGEIWRIVIVQERKENGRGLFEDFCLTDLDTVSYASLPLNEVVFWHEEGLVELPAFKVTFKAVETDEVEHADVRGPLARLWQKVLR